MRSAASHRSTDWHSGPTSATAGGGMIAMTPHASKHSMKGRSVSSSGARARMKPRVDLDRHGTVENHVSPAGRVRRVHAAGVNELLDHERGEVERDAQLQRSEDDGDAVRLAQSEGHAHEQAASRAAERKRAHSRDGAAERQPAREHAHHRACADGEDGLRKRQVQARVVEVHHRVLCICVLHAARDPSREHASHKAAGYATLAAARLHSALALGPRRGDRQELSDLQLLTFV